MAWYIRKIEKVALWSTAREQNVLYSNCLGCLRTSGQGRWISLWRADAQEDLDIILANLAGSRDRLSDIHYAKLPEAAMEGVGFPVQQTDEGAPIAGRLRGAHYNVTIGTARNLLRFADVVLASAEFEVRTKKQLADFVAERLDAGDIEEAGLTRGFLEGVRGLARRHS